MKKKKKKLLSLDGRSIRLGILIGQKRGGKRTKRKKKSTKGLKKIVHHNCLAKI